MKEFFFGTNLPKIQRFGFILFCVTNILTASQPPLSLQEYGLSSQKTIRDFNDLFAVAFAEPLQGEKHALSVRENRNTLIAVSEEINSLYDGNVIVSVGQSPAYIVRAAQILNELRKDSKTKYRYLAFSGKFLEEGGINDHRKEFVATVARTPTEEQITSYTRYLESLRLDPKAIIKRYRKKSQKTIFTDFIISAKGFASFVYTLHAIAQRQGIEEESLQNGVGYHVFKKNDINLNFNALDIKDSGYSYFCDLSQNNLQAVDTKLIFNLAREKMNTLFKDRLVPSFPKSCWTENNTRQFQLSDNAKLLIFKLTHHIARRNQASEQSKKKQRLLPPVEIEPTKTSHN
jgi:hypothetical protein